MERECRSVNWLNDAVRTTCASGNIEKSIDGKFEWVVRGVMRTSRLDAIELMRAGKPSATEKLISLIMANLRFAGGVGLLFGARLKNVAVAGFESLPRYPIV